MTVILAAIRRQSRPAVRFASFAVSWVSSGTRVQEDGRLVLITSIAMGLSLAGGLLLRAPQTLQCAIFAPNGLRHFLKMQYADQTFRGLYTWNAFDATLLIPYFAVMIVLAVYGVHRYQLVYLYYKHRKDHQPDPPGYFAE